MYVLFRKSESKKQLRKIYRQYFFDVYNVSWKNVFKKNISEKICP